MLIQDILPITSILLIILGASIILIAFIWLAHTISNEQKADHLLNAEDIIGEMNQMFTYFTNKIGKEPDTPILIDQSLEHEYYSKVIEYSKQGKTPDEIAKILNMGKGEVNLILGINQMR